LGDSSGSEFALFPGASFLSIMLSWLAGSSRSGSTTHSV